MRKYIICIVSFIGAALLQTGCYDDKQQGAIRTTGQSSE